MALRRALSLTSCALLFACNTIAGLDDLREGVTGTDASLHDAATDADPTLDGAAADAGSDAREPPDSSCFTLTLKVGGSRSGKYTGVSEKSAGLISAGLNATNARCLPPSTFVDLRAIPDDSNAVHTWVGPCANTPRRCTLTMTATTTVSVELQ